MSDPKLDDAVARAYYVERFDDFLALEQGASVQTSRAYKLDIARFVTYASVKGKSNEGMGWIGRKEGLACIAVATLKTKP